jgi:gliding motility-associated-like protein
MDSISPSSLEPDPGNGNTDPPLVDAGEDQTLRLPDNATSLTGTFSSEEGLIESILWNQIQGNNDAIISDPTQESIDISNLTRGTYIFELTVNDNFGQSSSDDVAVIVEDENGGNGTFDAMKIFSPNNDGYNDEWILDPNPASFNDCQVTIYDRKGMIVFEANPYLNNWDATKKGKVLKEGVYYYIVRCNNNENNDSGSVTVVR